MMRKDSFGYKDAGNRWSTGMRGVKEVADYVVKPVDIEKLIDSIRVILS